MKIRGQTSVRAFTLVELLVGASLSAAVMAAVFSSYIFLGRSLARLANQQTIETESRRTLGQFTHDVQLATGIDTSMPLSAIRVSLTVPTATGTSTITYYYNSSSATAPVIINGATIDMAAQSLTRCVYDGTSVTTQTLLRNITDNNSATSEDLAIRYYDASHSEYTNYTDYLPGIKQLALQFNTQLGNADNGTQTRVYHVASSRVILRNRGFLP